jgi:hypothetical protein
MASAVGRALRANRRLCSVSPPCRHPVAAGTRGLAVSPRACYRRTPDTLQQQQQHEGALSADKYQKTTITEDVQRAAAQQNWPDPRSGQGSPETDGGAMMDPTIRHFTINFVCPPAPSSPLARSLCPRAHSIPRPMASCASSSNWTARKSSGQIRISVTTDPPSPVSSCY